MKQIEKVVSLADEIHRDIRKRKLKPGDRYLTTLKLAKQLQVDTGLANQALQLLVKRQVLERRQRKGTFIAQPAPETACAAAPGRIQMLVCGRHPEVESMLGTAVVLGLQSVLPQTEIQLQFFPEQQELEGLQQTVEQAMRSPDQEAFVLIASTVEMQRLMAASGLTTVVFGSLYASITGLSSLDLDHRQAGRLAAEHCLAVGHQRLLLLARQRILPGDHLMIEGMQAVLEKAGLPCGSLRTRFVPHDSLAVKAEVAAALAAKNPPTAIITGTWMADRAAEVIGETKRGKNKPSLLVCGQGQPGRALPRYAAICPQLSMEQQGAELGRIFSRLSGDAEPQPILHRVPVHLVSAEDESN